MADYLPVEPNEWDQYIGPSGVPRISISAPVAEQPLPSEPTEFDNDPFVRAAERLRRRHQQFPVYGPPAPEKLPSYLIEPDLLEAQQGQHLPTGIAYNEAGIPFNVQTGAEIPTVPRPNVLPVAKTPEGYTFAMPKVLDVFGNMMGGVAGAPVKAGEVLLGSGPVRKLTPVKGNPFEAAEDLRLARGRELGYNVDETLYHATDAKTNFKNFKNGNGELGEGTYLTTDKTDPLLYFYSRGDNGRVIPVHIKKGDLFDFGALKETQLVGNTTGKEKAINEVIDKYIKNNTLGYKAGDEDLVKNMIANQLSRTGDINFILKQAGYVGGFDKHSQMPNQVIVFDPANIKSKFAKFKGEGNLLRSDTRNQVYSQIGHELEKPKPFFSALEKAVDTAKVGKADAQQWLGYLKNQPGVKSEELSYVLKDLPEGAITKEQLGDIIKGNKVELKEVHKGKFSVAERSDIVAQKMYGKNYNELSHSDKMKVTNNLEDFKDSSFGETKYHSYQLPGGERYQEMLLTLPEKKLYNEEFRGKFENHRDKLIARYGKLEDAPLHELQQLKIAKDVMEKNYELSNQFKSSHWDEPNIIAHVRHNDRMVDGKKILHLEEIQSDWHQKGRAEGYKLSDKQRKDLDIIEDKLTSKLTEAEIGNPDIDNVLKVAVNKKVISADEAKNYKDYVKGENSTVPDAPFKKNWDELALKRMLHKAAVEGYEGISWTPGEAQAARYDLSKHVDTLSTSGPDKNGKYLVYIEGKDKQPLFRNRDGFSEYGQKVMTAEELENTVGKDVAKKAIEGAAKNKNNEKTNGFFDLKGEGLKIGGEGMKSFYDKMLVDRANNLAKKYGSKVEQRTIDGKKTSAYQGPPHTVESLREIIGKLNKSSEPVSTANGIADIIKEMKNGIKFEDAVDKHYSYNVMKALGGKEIIKADKQPIHYLPITPELRQKAKEGFPLFSATPITVPVSYDPFKSEDKKIKLIPIEGNPFQ